LSYEIVAEQCSEDLPSDGADAVDGEVRTRFDIDEQHRKTSVLEYDCLIDGDPQAFHEGMRGWVDDPDNIFRESFEATSIKGVRVRGSFMTISGADDDDLVSWTQTVSVAQDQQVYEEHAYPGVQPIAVLKPATLGKIVQTGQAISVGDYADAPDAIPTLLSALPVIEYTSRDVIENVTIWRYEGYAADADSNPINFDPTTNTRPSGTGS
jgi:hypothetical protein